MAGIIDRMLGRKKPEPAPPRKPPTPRESAIQEMEDEKMRKAMEKAYDKAMPYADPEYETRKGKKFAKGGKIDGCARKGKTRGKMV